MIETTETHTVFISVDGKRFNNRHDCEIHEAIALNKEDAIYLITVGKSKNKPITYCSTYEEAHELVTDMHIKSGETEYHFDILQVTKPDYTTLVPEKLRCTCVTKLT